MKECLSEWNVTRETLKGKGGVATYIFHVHLDAWIHRGACVFDNAHPPGLRVGEERRRRR
jgi:hypothetical protein